LVSASVSGSSVTTPEASMHKIRRYLPRHECLTTKYLARYSGSSVSRSGS
jgi:hypothetical protein